MPSVRFRLNGAATEIDADPDRSLLDILRGQLGNVFDRYGWSVLGGGAYVYNQPRRFSMYLATDL